MKYSNNMLKLKLKLVQLKIAHSSRSKICIPNRNSYRKILVYISHVRKKNILVHHFTSQFINHFENVSTRLEISTSNSLDHPKLYLNITKSNLLLDPKVVSSSNTFIKQNWYIYQHLTSILATFQRDNVFNGKNEGIKGNVKCRVQSDTISTCFNNTTNVLLKCYFITKLNFSRKVPTQIYLFGRRCCVKPLGKLRRKSIKL